MMLGVQPERLKENVYLAPILNRETKGFSDGGVGALPEVLEAYVGEVVWPHPSEAKQHGLHGHWPNVRP